MDKLVQLLLLVSPPQMPMFGLWLFIFLVCGTTLAALNAILTVALELLK